MNIIKFWAKTTHEKNEYPNAYHPLICHLIDVAAVIQEIWKRVLSDAEKSRIAKALGLENDLELAGKIVAFIAGLHDLGKCSPPFTLRGHNDSSNNQTHRLLNLYENDKELYQPTAEPAKNAPHGYVTACELPEILFDEFNFPPELINDIAVLIGGHHGIFPTTRRLEDLSLPKFSGNKYWKLARKDLTIKLAEVLKLPDTINFQEKPNLTNADVMVLAGLVSVADWIGSNTEFFVCEIEDFEESDFAVDFDEYAIKSRRQAKESLQSFGWILTKDENSKIDSNDENQTNEENFKKLFPFIDNRRHLQDMAIEIGKELNETGIIIVEAPTGEGKTEAAMYLADIWNKNLKLNGYYFALPTQATSNQMFGRVNDFLQKSFPNKNVHNQLLHGHASLSAEFQTLKENHQQHIKNISDDECVGDSCTPSVVAAEWFTYKKRGLLAPFGVGTIDQALLAVLQTKHVFVRLFGLAHKTIIIDEVHAYDAYMSAILEHLLEWLAALGSPVIMLSATLPFEKRKQLLKAYQRGLGNKSVEIEKGIYPRITYAVGKTIKTQKLKTSSNNCRTVNLEKVDENFIEDIKKKLEDGGGCVAIICNTVARSQELFDLLSNEEFFIGNDKIDGLPKVDLLHSHFRYRERKKIEERTLIRFGKEDGEVQVSEKGNTVTKKVKRPEFAVLISTQIIEQSLDLDFDLMISELAPIDLLLQRAGRLQRHERKYRLPQFTDEPVLWIIKSQIDENDLPDFGKSRYVYSEHILLRTWLKIKEIPKIEVPGEIEELIEFVYGKEEKCTDEKYAETWNETEWEMTDKLKKKKRKAEGSLIARSNNPNIFENIILGLDEDNPDTHRSLQALTRDVEVPSVSVVILKIDEISKVDLGKKPNRRTSEYLLKREAKISKYELTNAILDDEELKPKAWKTSPLLRNHRLLKLNDNNEIEIDKYKIKLDELLGIVIDKKEKK
ncbi:MAG: CRISPR-associated helicase Cas3' [Acidobacteriota bacterium]|nr:CRISPR-associated helicase Cas3' [Acidobacteriota bacterium]